MNVPGISPNDLSLGFVEALYADFLNNADSVPEDWRSYFQKLSEDASDQKFRAHPQLGPSQMAPGLFQTVANSNGAGGPGPGGQGPGGQGPGGQGPGGQGPGGQGPG